MFAYERSKGKKPTTMAIEFGEKLLYMEKKRDRLNKIKSRWGFGIFGGVKRKSNKIMLRRWMGLRKPDRNAGRRKKTDGRRIRRTG